MSVLKSQPMPAKTQCEIMPLQLNTGISTYRGRNAGNYNWAQGTVWEASVFWPFQWSVRLQERPDSEAVNTHFFFHRKFMLRPVSGIQGTDQNSLLVHTSLNLSFKMTPLVYLSLSTGFTWVEAVKTSKDGLTSGFNLIQIWELVYNPFNRWAFSVGAQHVSTAHLFKGDSNQDQIKCRIYFRL